MKKPGEGRCGGPFLFFATLCGLVIAGVVTVQSATTAEPGLSADPAAQQRSPRAGSKIVVGEFPPDFELPLLTFGEDGDGKPIGIISDRETFKLSSFRGKKPVCMIMSSYT